MKLGTEKFFFIPLNSKKQSFIHFKLLHWHHFKLVTNFSMNQTRSLSYIYVRHREHVLFFWVLSVWSIQSFVRADRRGFTTQTHCSFIQSQPTLGWDWMKGKVIVAFTAAKGAAAFQTEQWKTATSLEQVWSHPAIQERSNHSEKRTNNIFYHMYKTRLLW